MSDVHIGDESIYNIAAIRNLLLTAFTAEELRRFCQDRPVFQPVVVRFGPGLGLDDMVDRLIDYCRTRFLWEQLLSEVKAIRPRQYARFESRLRKVEPAPSHLPSSMVPSPSRSAPLPRRWLVLGLVGVAILVLIVVSVLLDRCSTPVEPTATRAPTRPPTAEPATNTPSPTPTGTDTPSPTPTDTDTPSPTPTATRNPGLGVFWADFDRNTPMVVIQHRQTVGSVRMCAFHHNLYLSDSDVDKQLSFTLEELITNASQDSFYLNFYRSLIGPMAAGDTVDMYVSPEMEPALELPPGENAFNFPITRPGDYLICLEADPLSASMGGSATYRVMLRGG